MSREIGKIEAQTIEFVAKNPRPELAEAVRVLDKFSCERSK